MRLWDDHSRFFVFEPGKIVTPIGPRTVPACSAFVAQAEMSSPPLLMFVAAASRDGSRSGGGAKAPPLIPRSEESLDERVAASKFSETHRTRRTIVLIFVKPARPASPAQGIAYQPLPNEKATF